MNNKIAVVSSLVLCGLGLAYARTAPTNDPGSALPYYESRDFTPRWIEVNHRVGAFHLLDQENRAVSEKDLDRKIHVASFLFAQCPSLCPTLVQKLKPGRKRSAVREMF